MLGVDMFNNTRDLSELMIAKLIHDIAGAVGAISNGLEYLQDEEATGPIKEQAFELAHESSEQLMARVQFFRIAYGYIYQTQEISISQIQQLAIHFFEGSKTTLNWDNSYTDSGTIPLSNKMGKLLLNMLLITSGCLLEGGTITVKLERIDNGKRVILEGEGPSVQIKSDWRDVLEHNNYPANLDSKIIQIIYTNLLMKECGAECTIDSSDNSITFSATYHQQAESIASNDG